MKVYTNAGYISFGVYSFNNSKVEMYYNYIISSSYGIKDKTSVIYSAENSFRY